VAKQRYIDQSEWGRALARLMASSRDCKTQGALAWKSGVAQSTIGRIVRGETSPRTGTLTFLARALRVPLKTFVAIADDEKSPNKPSDSLESAEQFNAVKMTEEIDRALIQALACREDRKRGEYTLATLRRRENDAIERLQELVRDQRSNSNEAQQ
jgi:transcriptional regulator with XRE-family HTH domain